MAEFVTHRWHAAEGRSPGAGLPRTGDRVTGPRNAWLVVEVLPIESKIHPNAWKARLRPLGPHRGDTSSRWVYGPTAANDGQIVANGDQRL